MFLSLLISLFLGASNVHAAETLPPQVQIVDQEGIIKKSFLALPKKFTGGLSIAAADLYSDGNVEIIVGSGLGAEPRVYIYSKDGVLIKSFLAYEKSFGSGVRVATGDVDGDGKIEIITGTGLGGGPHVRIFDGNGVAKNQGFFAYDPTSRGGVFVTVRDLDGDGKAEIITGAGPGSEPRVKIFSDKGDLINSFLAFDATDLSGVTVGTADINGDGKPEILAGRATSGPSELKVFSPDGVIEKTLTLFDSIFDGGLTAQGAQCDADGREDVLISSNGVLPKLQCINSDGVLIYTFDLFPADYTGSVQAAWSKLSADDPGSLIVAPSRAYREGSADQPQEIKVNLAEQRLYAYEHGVLVKSFLVSTGIAKYPTPPGNYSVQKKIPIKDYVWTYGVNSPDNYNLPKVKWNLQFRPRYYLHYAYWHHNFGHPMSHGCVNMALDTAEWIYNWANVGTPVIVK